MAHLLEVEGQNTRQNDVESYDEDPATSKWLKKNKLNHLILVFAEESITIDELMEMEKETLDTFLDELVNDDTIKKFKKRDKIRIISKLKQKQNDNVQNEPKQEYKQQQKPQRIIITEAETSALDSLDNKYKQLSLQKKSIEERLNEFETEYIKQQKILNSAFNKVVLNVEVRRNVLLNEMKQKHDEYKDKLSKRIKSVANQRSLLSQIKNKSEQDINNSSVTSLQGAQKRANKTVQLIDETLLSVEQHYDESKINNNIYVQFDMSKQVHDDIKQWGQVKIIGDIIKPPAPKINFVTVGADSIDIELLCDENYTGVVSTYEYEFIKEDTVSNNDIFIRDMGMFGGYSKLRTEQKSSPFSNSPNTSVSNKSQQRVMSNDSKIVNKNDKNVAFYWLRQLQPSTTYKIRCRAVVKDNVESNWSEWFAVTTLAPRNKNPKKKIPRAHFPIQKQFINMDEWCDFCNEKNISLSVYQLQRVFYYVKFQQETNSQRFQRQKHSKISRFQQQRSSDNVAVHGFESLINYAELHSAEWKEFQKNLYQIYK